MKLSRLGKWRQESSRGKRFFTLIDMASVKLEEEIMNSRIKRGELTRHNNQFIRVCGCGAEGCFIHGSFKSKEKLQ
jgi:hypothetical protein